MEIDLNMLITFLGTAIGTCGGIIASSKLTTYRLEQLEKKVELHNNAVERLYKVEETLHIHDDKIEWLKDNTQHIESP